jgi:hypothetical protein
VTTAPDALTVLIEALDTFAGALETGRADVVLAAGESLAAAVSGIRTADLALLSRHPHTRARVDEARQKLTRCRALGAAASGMTALVGMPGYGPRGRQATPVPPAATVASRV